METFTAFQAIFRLAPVQTPACTHTIRQQSKSREHYSSVYCYLCSVVLHVQVLWSETLQIPSGDGLRPGSLITSIAFLPELEALCIAATCGELLLVLPSREVQEARQPLSVDTATQHCSTS